MKKVRIFVPITKVDVEKREVWGRMVEETPDKSGEVFDYATSRPLFDAWSDGFAKATDGKSLGNVRAMHGAVAAGKVIAYQPDDAAKAIDIGTKIVDDAEWAKVEEGVYTGFSIGGKYEKRWKDAADPTLTRYTASPVEVSIVDNPCVPSATFSLVKADGVVEERAFAPAPATVAGVVQKGLWSVSRLADLLQSVTYLAQDSAWEAEYEGDGSGVPAQLRDWLGQGVTILTMMVSEEGAEAVASVPAAPGAAADETLALAATGEVAKAAAAALGDVLKAGARHSRTDSELLQNAHDHLVALGAACATPAGDDAEEDADKTAGGALAKRAAAADGALAKVTELTTELAKRDARIKALEALPEPTTKGARLSPPVAKAADAAGAPAPATAVTEEDDFLSAIRKVHQAGGQPLR